jgi:subtilisin
MVGIDHPVERREVLALAGGALTAAAGAAGVGAGASDGTVRVNVGYAAESGKRAALAAADEVVRVFDSIDAVTVRVTGDAREALAERSDVRYVERDGRMRALAQTTPWGVDRIDADVVHANGETGAGVDVAIIDTGIDDDHEDLQANVADPSVDSNHKAWVACEGPNCNYPWSDDHDHGTYGAGIVDAVDNTVGVIGVATEARLHSLKVFDNSGSGRWSDIASALEYTADQGWHVANMGFGNDVHSSLVKDACTYAWQNGVLLVVAAGNDGPCTDCVIYPAKYDECIAVSGSSCDDSFASYSSQGEQVELIAPADDVPSTVIGGYDTRSGTSGAVPHVSGTGAHLMANGYSNAGARDRMCETAEDIGLPPEQQGCGLVDTAAALGYDSSDDGGCNDDDGSLL